MKIAVINGANLNMLGIREVELYGTMTYSQMMAELEVFAQANNITIDCFQSNHEGEMIDFIHSCYQRVDAIVINAGAYSHTSIALLDALLAVNLPAVEVHITDTNKRENYRKTSFLRLACLTTFQGEGLHSYEKALLYLQEEFSE